MDIQNILKSVKAEISTQLQSDIIFGEIDKSINSQLNIQNLFSDNGYIIGKNDIWELIPTDLAKFFFKKLITESLAYSSIVFDDNQASSLWKKLTSIQNGAFNCYTNTYDVTEFIKGKSRGWFPVTKSTFDASMVFVDDEKVIALVITDED
jgi:hypothetical protein